MIGWFQPAQGFDDIRAEAVYVGDGRILADPDAVIDAATEVLGEMTVDIGIDGGECISRVQGDDSCVHFGLPISGTQPDANFARRAVIPDAVGNGGTFPSLSVGASSQ